MLKSFSTVRDTWKGTQSYMEKERRRREREVARRKRGGIKRGESKLASNHLSMCSPQSGSLRDVHGVTQGKKREEGDRGGQEDKGGIKRRETDPASNQFPKCSHSPEHTKRFPELGREEKREGGDRGDLVEEKRESKVGESSQASNLAPK